MTTQTPAPDAPQLGPTPGEAGPRVLDVDRGRILARVSTLLALADPRGADLWRVGPVTADDVRAVEPHALAHGGACPAHATTPRNPDPLLRPACRPCEVGRVSWFVHHPDALGDLDDPHPVCLDAGYGPFVPDWPFPDGNHRLLAAALRGAVDFVPVAVIGDWEWGVTLLVDERDPRGSAG